MDLLPGQASRGLIHGQSVQTGHRLWIMTIAQADAADDEVILALMRKVVSDLHCYNYGSKY
jgi:hypothetical protein